MNSDKLLNSARAVDFLVAKKIVYSWDDVAEDVRNGTSTNVVQEEYNLTFYDTLPPYCGQQICNIANVPQDYVFFIKNYSAPDLEIKFLNPGPNETEVSNATTAVVVHPFGIEYYYPQYGQNELFLYIPDNLVEDCDEPESYGCPVNWVFLEINITDYNFSGSPFWSKYWGCAPPAEECVAINVTVRDVNGTRWVSDKYYFDTDKKSTLDIPLAGCPAGTRVLIGKQQAGDRKTIDIVNGCGAQMKTAMTLNFNTLNYWVDFLSVIKVRDVNYNASRKALITG